MGGRPCVRGMRVTASMIVGLAANKTTAPSVLQLRSQYVLPATIVDAVIRAIRTAQPRLESGALVTVDPLGQRIRLLPI